MNKRLKAKVLEALRSGKYRQGRNRLCSISGRGAKERFCVLGVIGEEAGKHFRGNKQKLFAREPGSLLFGERISAMCSFGDKQLNALGISDTEQTYLIDLNDRERLSFQSLADWIEENL